MEAAVAVIRLAVPTVPDPAWLLVRRADNPRDPWSGHFAFPGGRRDPGDPDLLAACIRETREECGFTLPETGFRRALPVTMAGNALGRPVPVTPFLFELDALPEIRLDPVECAGHLWLPESALRDPARQVRIRPLPSLDRAFPAIRIDGTGAEDKPGHVWGFTYGVLANLLGLPE